MSLSPCAQIVKTHHRSAYLYGLLAPEAVREHVFAIYALNYEIEHIRTTVSEEMVGLIRLQWWRDAMASLYEGKSRNHDVVQAVEQLIQKFAIPQEKLETFFTAHENDYVEAPFSDVNALEDYCNQSNVILLHFLLLAFEIKNDCAYECAEYLGKAEQICAMLRLLPYHLQQGWCTLPKTLLQQQGISAEDVLTGVADPQKISPSIYALIEHAEGHFKKAQALKSSLSKEALLALRMASLLPSQLKQLKKTGVNLLNTPIALSPLMTPIRLWRGVW